MSRIEPISLICIGHGYEQALATVPDGIYDLRDAGEEGILPSEIVERYQDRSSDPRGTQQVRTYREKLERYDLVESEGSSRWDRWFVVDETLKQPLRETAAL